MQTLMAAALYFALVFAAGMLLGPIRALWIEPKTGAAIAVLSEAPFMLAVMLWAARWVPQTAGITSNVSSLLLMGVIALVFQQIADFLLSVRLRGITAKQQLAYCGTKAGLVYAILLILFAIMPLIANLAL